VRYLLVANRAAGGHERDLEMRVMEIPAFPQKIEIPDLDRFYRARLSETDVIWPEQAIQLLGYKCYPNDPEARDALRRTIWSWQNGSEAAPLAVPEGLSRIEKDWLRVADIFHLHCDLVEGQHQARRGGPSIGKAITLMAANAKSLGTGTATLWKNWSAYKDVAHLVTAVALICAEARTRCRNKPLGPFQPSWKQLVPFQMAMLMPDLVLAVALDFERFGLSVVPHARTEPTLDPRTVWRIPPDINVRLLPLLKRKIRGQDRRVLNSRRAGNRGKANVPKAARLRETTPVSR
jgi:hypothetical protein